MAPKILIPRLFIFSLILSLVGGMGCKKKDRLTTSTSVLSVTPSATALLKGETVTLTSQRRAPNGSVEVLPSDWVVSGCGSSSNLNVDFGESVVFTAPNNLCDTTVTATFGGETATSHIAVVTYKPATANFNVYSDLGIPSTRIDLGPTPAALTITEPSTGYAPEGNKYLHFVPSLANSFWFIQLSTSTSFSGYNSGKIKFSIYLESAGEVWQIKVP